jgi:hypothetical protein
MDHTRVYWWQEWQDWLRGPCQWPQGNMFLFIHRKTLKKQTYSLSAGKLE